MIGWSALLGIVPILGFWAIFRRSGGFSASSSLLLAVSTMLVILYLGGLLGQLRWTALAVHSVGVLAALVYVAGAVRTRQPLTPPVPVGVLVLLTAAFWLVHHDSRFVFYDEFSHWGIFLKEMVAHDGYWGAESSAMHPRYVPGPALWQYFFGLLTRQQTDGVAYLAQFTLLITPVMVLWDKLRWDQPAWIIGLVLVLLTGFASFSPGIASLYVDHLVSTWFIGTILCFLASGERGPSRMLVFAVPLTALVLIKEAGLPFSIAAAGIMAVLSWRTGWTERLGVSFATLRSALVFLALVIPGGVAYQAWQLNRDALQVQHSRSSVSSVVGSLVSAEQADPQLRAEKSRRFFDVLSHQQLVKNATSWQFNAFSYPLMELYKDRFRLTMSSLMALFLAWQLVLLKWFVAGEDRWRLAIVDGGLLLTAGGYVAMLYFNYTVRLGEYGLTLSSMLRYLHTVALPLFFMTFVPLLPAFRTTTRSRAMFLAGRPISGTALVFTMVLVAFFIAERPYVFPLVAKSPGISLRPATDRVAEQLRALAGPGSIWVYLPNDQPNQFVGRFLQFQLSPVPTSVERSPGFVEQSPASLLESWSSYSVVWFASGVPEQLAGVPGLEIDASASVYRVVSETGSVRLVPVPLSVGRFSPAGPSG